MNARSPKSCAATTRRRRSKTPGRSRRPGTSTRGSRISSAGPSSPAPGRSSRRADQVAEPGQFVTRGARRRADRRSSAATTACCAAFFNVCRHHAAAVETARGGHDASAALPVPRLDVLARRRAQGHAGLRGRLQLRQASNGLVPVAVGEWENFVFVRLEPERAVADGVLGDLGRRSFGPLGLARLHFVERRSDLRLQLEGLRRQLPRRRIPRPAPAQGALVSVLDYSQLHDRQRRALLPPVEPDRRRRAPRRETGAVRKGDRALYYWIYPNFMINWYEGVMDTNLVLPLSAADSRAVIFDFYFTDVADARGDRAQQGVDRRRQPRPGRGPRDLRLRAEGPGARGPTWPGRLSVRREAGEHLFHRLLAADLKAGVSRS